MVTSRGEVKYLSPLEFLEKTEIEKKIRKYTKY
jgi:hypothetical protein